MLFNPQKGGLLFWGNWRVRENIFEPVFYCSWLQMAQSKHLRRSKSFPYGFCLASLWRRDLKIHCNLSVVPRNS